MRSCARLPLLLHPRSVVVHLQLCAPQTAAWLQRRGLPVAASVTASASELSEWHTALLACSPPRHLLLPRGHPEGSEACELLALLGDSYLKTSILTELGVGRLDSSARLSVAGLTRDVSSVASNAVLAAHAASALLPPGSPLTSADLECLSQHSLGTAVEAAIYHVHTHAGSEPLRCLVRLLLQPGRVENWKGLLLEAGGSVVCAAGNAGFVATASLPDGHTARSGEWPSKRGAEQAAAEEVLRAAGLDSAASRREAAAERTREAWAAHLKSGVQVQADWLLSHPLAFQAITMPVAALRAASEGTQAQRLKWFIRGMEKGSASAFQRMLGAPSCLSSVLAVHAWGAATGEGEETSALALMSVTLNDGQRWFASPGAQRSITQAREQVSKCAAVELCLIETAKAELASLKDGDKADERGTTDD